ncbi:MAG: nucleotidyl transferase AbiEii/AbiGii toxin family protein [Steroidobacteraceae bacterium]
MCVAGRHKRSQLFLDFLDASQGTCRRHAYLHIVVDPGHICLGCRQAAQDSACWIRAIASDLVKDAGPDALPPSRSQADKWREIIKERLEKWLNEKVLPYLRGCLEADKLAAKLRIEDGERIFIDYETQVEGYGYIGPHIQIDFGARSTGEASDSASVSCDAAGHLSDLLFPTTDVRVMRIERTAWEKMTAIHVFCLQGDIKDQVARHWSDVARLDVAGQIEAAIKDRHTAERVASHKSNFFRAKDAQGNKIEYLHAINGGLSSSFPTATD